jgi:alcohol dehydrogenase YqhD (iron-dependent ADH family)
VVVTASGTGSEQNNGAVITDEEKKVKGAMWGVFADCNHGQGLAVLHPILYRHIYKSAEEKFRRWAQEVWLVQDADEGIDFLADFIREVGLPTTFTEMGIILDDDTIRAIADSTIVTPGCCKQLTPNEIVEILKECK